MASLKSTQVSILTTITNITANPYQRFVNQAVKYCLRNKRTVNGNVVCYHAAYYHDNCTAGQGSQCAMQDTTKTISYHGVTTQTQVEVIGSNGHGHSIHIFWVTVVDHS